MQPIVQEPNVAAFVHSVGSWWRQSYWSLEYCVVLRALYFLSFVTLSQVLTLVSVWAEWQKTKNRKRSVWYPKKRNLSSVQRGFTLPNIGRAAASSSVEHNKMSLSIRIKSLQGFSFLWRLYNPSFFFLSRLPCHHFICIPVNAFNSYFNNQHANFPPFSPS